MISSDRQTAGITTRLIVRYVRSRSGDEAVGQMLRIAGESRPAAALEDESVWSTYDQKIRLFEAAAAVLGDPHVARHVGEAVLDERVGTAVKVLLRATGSPAQVLRNIARAAPKFSTVCTMSAPHVDHGHATVTYRLHDGFTPSRWDCDYNIGLISQVNVLFGHPPARVTHDRCQVRGATECVYEVSLPSRKRRLRLPRSRVAHLTDQLQTLSERAESLQTTIADLASPDAVDVVLSRIAARASEAVRAQAYLLVLAGLGRTTRTLHHDGLTDEQAHTLANRICDAEPGTIDHAMLVVDVASSRRSYGKLAALYPHGGAFFPEERRLLAAFARHAAVALDAAVALEDARRRGEAAEALFEMSRSLSSVTTESEVAQRLAEAAPRITSAQRCVVAYWNAAEQTLDFAAAYGFDATSEAQLRALRVSLDDTPELKRMLETHEPQMHVPGRTTDPFIEGILEALGSTGVVAVPILVRDEFAGIISIDGMSERARDHERFTQDLRSLADQGAIALENVRLVSRLKKQAYRDSQTGLPNAALFRDRLQVALAHAERSGESLAVLFLDLDRFKNVNDNLGHSVGDELLTFVGRRLVSSVRAGDTVCRMGGDEFTLLLPNVGGPDDAMAVAQKILDGFRTPFALGLHEVFISPSVGIAMYPQDGIDVDELLKNADMAMYRAKDQGRNTYQLFSRAMNDEAFERFALESNLHRAIERGELDVHYQPQIELSTRRVAGAEALVRWTNPKLGLLVAASFLPIAEESGLIVQIDEWVLRKVCAQGRAWLDRGFAPLRLSVNLSPRMLQSRSLEDVVLGALHDTGFPPELLQIEMPESITTLDPDHVAPRLWTLARGGVHFAIDDFGAGYTFLSHLRSLPIESLKLDKTLVQTVAGSEQDASVVRAVIALAHSLKIRAIAEGAETQEQREFLERFQCDELQGYIVSPAIPAKEFEAMLSRDRSHAASG